MDPLVDHLQSLLYILAPARRVSDGFHVGNVNVIA